MKAITDEAGKELVSRLKLAQALGSKVMRLTVEGKRPVLLIAERSRGSTLTYSGEEFHLS